MVAIPLVRLIVYSILVAVLAAGLFVYVTDYASDPPSVPWVDSRL